MYIKHFAKSKKLGSKYISSLPSIEDVCITIVEGDITKLSQN